MVRALEAGEGGAFLLHGVTGSGKTEVYLQAIDHALKQGRSCIVLVPEIALTPQMVQRFKGRLGKDVAVLHSKLGLGERYDQWRGIREGRHRVVIGARSALFAPMDDLGLIVIDEEHETTYKEGSAPRYNAGRVALELARDRVVTEIPKGELPTDPVGFVPANEVLSVSEGEWGLQLPETQQAH